MMRQLLLILLFFTSAQAFAQKGMLFIKKKGHKVARYEEGSFIIFRTRDGALVQGAISYIFRDTFYVNNLPWTEGMVRTVIRNRDENSGKAGETFLYTTAGVVLATTGMTLAKWAPFKTALLTSAGLGYGQYLIQFLPHFKRNKFPIGKKFTLQLIDLHF